MTNTLGHGQGAIVTAGSTRDEILNRVETLDSLPTLPVVVDRLNKEIASRNASAASIARIIEDDQAIMTRVLRLVNSPLFAPTFKKRGGVTIQEAVVRLGMTELRNIVLTTSMMTLFPSRADAAFDRSEFWRHSVCVGLVAKVVRDFSKLKLSYEESELALAGLCHDIGKVILDQYFNAYFNDALGRARRDSVLLYEAELMELGVDHGEVGAALARRWKLNEQYATVMRYHHFPDRAAGKPHEMLVRVVQLADYICNHQNLGFSGNCRTMEFPKATFDMLGIDVFAIPDIIDRVHQQAEQSEVLLAIGTGAPAAAH